MDYRRNRRITLVILIMAIALFIMYVYASPRALKARKNVANSEKIEIGMTKEEVIYIMGEPDKKRLSFWNTIDSMYYYEPPFSASEGIYIQFDSIDTVNEIVPFE